ncbi:Autotransporter-associated beta strand repeat protein [Planctomycetes bacterium K23_9]|uniref:Autotransporter-associated beta strand repeat protein n=2 Tax=Stieleria marina TaxID=1930275 RepID=A0A517NYK2_9BACT|nr:Autotransporter-associated beta strand repeat protein [Planctomycetes bacterium K23_9]
MQEVIRPPSSLRPSVRTLEPRFVLNATAELTMIGDLVLSGDAGADVINFNELGDGSISITDASGAVIPIANHPGSDTDPLPVAAVTSGRVLIDLGGGDDSLNLALPAGLDVTLSDSAGDDDVIVSFSDRVEAATGDSINIEAETIQLEPGQGNVSLTNDDVTLRGNVSVGDLANATSVELGTGDLRASGSIHLAGDVSFFSIGGSVDFSDATLSATQSGTDLVFQLNHATTADLTFGAIDDSAGESIENIHIIGASSVSFSSSVELSGDLTAQGIATTVDIDASISADSIQMRSTEQLTVNGDLVVETGVVSLLSNDRVMVQQTIDTTAAVSAGRIDLISPDLQLSQAILRTQGADVSLIGDTLIDGPVVIDSAVNATDGGDVRFFGLVGGVDQINDRLEIRSIGQTTAGTVEVQGDIGSPFAAAGVFDLNSLAIDAGVIDLRSVGITGGVLNLTAPIVRMSGPQWVVRSTATDPGQIVVDGQLFLPTGDARIDIGDDFQINGAIAGQAGSNQLTVASGGNVDFRSTIENFDTLIVQSDGSTSFGGDIDLQQQLNVASQTGIQVSAPSITTGQEMAFRDAVFFQADIDLLGASIRFDDEIVTLNGTTTTAFSGLVNPGGAVDAITKSGDGTLVLGTINHFTAETVVQSGTLRVSGGIADGAGQVTVQAGATLSGDGAIEADVVVLSGGRLSPGNVSGIQLAGLDTHAVDLQAGSIYEVQINGPVATSQYDQLIVGEGTALDDEVAIDGAILDLQLNYSPLPASEFVLVRNDGVDEIDGRFAVNFDIDGNLLSAPRTLDEGDLVRSPFGSRSDSAFITYFGGDGNDIAIVTEGDVTFDADQVTLVVRQGTDLVVRTGADLVSAQSATPTVRPIAGLNDNNLRLVDTPGDDVIFVDVDGLVDKSGNALSFSGNLAFDGNAAFADNDRIILFDSDPDTDDLPDIVDYAMNDDRTGAAVVSLGDRSFTLSFTGLERIEQDITSDETQIVYGDDDQLIQVDIDLDAPQRTLFQADAAAGPTTMLSTNNPTQFLSIDGAGGDDQIIVNGFGSSTGDFRASLSIDGATGDDSVIINADLLIGSDQSAGDLTVRAETVSLLGEIDATGGFADGHVLVTGGSSIVVGDAAVSNVAVNTGQGTINLDGNGGSIDTRHADLTSLFDGEAILFGNASSVLLGDIDVAQGVLVIGQNADVTGTISQLPQSSIFVERLAVSSSGAVDLANDNNQIGSIDSIASGGGVIVVDATDDLVVGGIDSNGSDIQVTAQGTVALKNDAVVADGAVVTVTAGDAIVDLDGDDNRRNLVARVVNLFAGAGGIGEVANAIDVVATESLNATTGVFGGDIFLANEGGEILIGKIDAGLGNISLVADSINDDVQDEISDIVGADLTMTAIDGIGSLRRIELQNVNQLDAVTINGGVDLDWNADSTTLISRVTAETGLIRIVQSGQQRMQVREVTNLADSIVITNSDQSIDVIGNGTDEVAIGAGENGSIELVAIGNASDVFVRGAIVSHDGSVRIAADRNVVFTSAGDVRSMSGNLSVTADDRAGEFGGGISMADGTLFDVGSGTVSLVADGSIGLGGITTTNATETAVAIRSVTGKITDRGDADVDIQAAIGKTNLVSWLGIGDGNALETNLAILDSRVTAEGSLELNEVDEIELRSVDTFDGLIRVVAGGTITATDILSQNQSRFDDAQQPTEAGSRDVVLTTSGSSSDILVHRITADHSADVVLTAADDVLDIDWGDQRRITADDLRVRSANGTEDQGTAVGLSTSVNDVDSIVAGDNRGDIEIRETDTINLAASDDISDRETLTTSNGEIRVMAGQSIRISDTDLGNDGADLRSDQEIVAGGDHGRVSLIASNTIDVSDSVQISASQSTINAVLVEATDVILGQQFQIETGQGVGVARVFAPRPVNGLEDTAFYDSTSVTTNVLEQAAINDAEGKLTVDIGNEGERGLTINIDWGADTDRFQQIDGLSGDAPPLVVSHVYLEQDILETRLNDRASATAPLNVNFAVRHHESIRVIGDTIAQGESEVLVVGGRILSSTDNPLTAESQDVAILENGQATFIIPSLSIPVAFFPVRNVIPELSEPEVFVQTEQSVALSQSSFTVVESSVSNSVSREEYFQIRILSPNPDGEDLAAPEQLPDDILDGSKLRELFAELPDGRYEIEYVLGDGNERSILQVDLRGGRPIISGDELDGGPMKLREVGEDDSQAREPGEDSASDVDPVERVKAEIRRQNRDLDVPRLSPDDESANLESSYFRESTKMFTPEFAASLLGLTTAGHRSKKYFSAGKRFRRKPRQDR